MSRAMKASIPAMLLFAACASDGEFEDGAAKASAKRIDCKGAFDRFEALPAVALPFDPNWNGRPAAAQEIAEPLDLDGDGAQERVLIGTFLANLDGYPEYDVHKLVVIGEASPLFQKFTSNDLHAIFLRQMDQRSAQNSIPNVERISFHGFLEDMKLEPDGKDRGAVWSGVEYAQYFNQHGVFAAPLQSLPRLDETLIEIGVINGEPLLLLTSKRDLFLDEVEAAAKGEFPLEYRFLVKYLGDFRVQVLCGEPVE